ncbi:hypothetical protein DIPPA_10961 [Diplonema papillatum]|nr:hypothetical protein DIPPA_10961 [Diplonema papillatum]
MQPLLNARNTRSCVRRLWLRCGTGSWRSRSTTSTGPSTTRGGRAGNGQPHANLVNLFPLDELSQFNWNGNPFRATQGSGTSEASPVNHLFPYWVAQAAPYF